MLGITEEEWVLLVKTIGTIRDIDTLEFWCMAGSRDFHPYQAVADAVNNAGLLCSLIIDLNGQTLPSDPSGLAVLASALRAHKALQEVNVYDYLSSSWMEEVTQNTALDPVLRALPACPHLRKVVICTKYASVDAMKDLLQLPEDTELTLILNAEHWLVVADEIRESRCNIKHLSLVMVQTQDGFTDEAGVALAEALTINKTLRVVKLDQMNAWLAGVPVSSNAGLGALAYEAFITMLRVNTSLRLELPPCKGAGADEKLVESRNRMRIEAELNYVGRGRLLSSSQTPREEWVYALNELNSSNVDESPEFNISCLYSLLRLNPATCM